LKKKFDDIFESTRYTKVKKKEKIMRSNSFTFVAPWNVVFLCAKLQFECTHSLVPVSQLAQIDLF